MPQPRAGRENDGVSDAPPVIARPIGFDRRTGRARLRYNRFFCEVGAAATGVLDYYEIENRPVRRTALYHGLTNTALIGSYLLSLRRRKDHKADGGALALSALGATLIGLSGYLGGKLVYEQGVRVGEDHDGIPGAS